LVLVGLILSGFVARKYMKKYIRETTPEEEQVEKEKETLIASEETGIEEI
jgi:flagellar biosynthesis/type III secretory pathway M-ring protein FliF/YscJ